MTILYATGIFPVAMLWATDNDLSTLPLLIRPFEPVRHTPIKHRLSRGIRASLSPLVKIGAANASVLNMVGRARGCAPVIRHNNKTTDTVLIA